MSPRYLVHVFFLALCAAGMAVVCMNSLCHDEDSSRLHNANLAFACCAIADGFLYAIYQTVRTDEEEWHIEAAVFVGVCEVVTLTTILAITYEWGHSMPSSSECFASRLALCDSCFGCTIGLSACLAPYICYRFIWFD
jgi:hypothetical protein